MNSAIRLQILLFPLILFSTAGIGEDLPSPKIIRVFPLGA
jgi:hypothetical protein